uniref:Uncharacterized protein n=1 Tax=Arundo donax TaxID=35708 RepID=A0A0A9AV80_ARUDO
MESYQVYFQMDLASRPYLIGVSCNRRFNIETYFAHGVASPYFGPMGRVSSWVH